MSRHLKTIGIVIAILLFLLIPFSGLIFVAWEITTIVRQKRARQKLYEEQCKKQPGNTQ